MARVKAAQGESTTRSLDTGRSFDTTSVASSSWQAPASVPYVGDNPADGKGKGHGKNWGGDYKESYRYLP